MQKFSYRLIEDGSLCVTGYQGDEEEVRVPEGLFVTVLYDKVFAGHPEIVSLSIPDTVTDMGEFLFEGCTGLRRLKLPSRLRNIWGHTFARCALEEIVLPDRVEVIPPFAFQDCKNLKRVVCGRGMKEISSWAFSGCPGPELVCSPQVKVSPQAFDTREFAPWRKES